MKERIKEIIKKFNLSNSEFAEKVGVPKSGLSHILSGRNKASLDYVVKIIAAFPQLNIKWLLLGQQPMMLSESQIESSESVSKNKNEESKLSDEDLSEYKSKQDDAEDDEITPLMLSNENHSGGDNKLIEKIVFFYNDSTFKVYKSRFF